jgi:glycosyltransferase involved in cell wall biosynthesis
VITPHDDYSARLTAIGCHIIDVSFDNRSANPFNDWNLYQNLKSIYKRIGAEVIFHYVIKPNIYGSIAAAALRIRSVAVITGLGYTFSRKNWMNFIVRQMYRFALKKCQAVCFLNAEDAAGFVEDRIVSAAKIRVLPGEGIDTEYFLPVHKAEKRPFVFLMSARMLKSKGQAVFAEASGILRGKGYKFESHLIGFFEKNHLDSISHEQLEDWQVKGFIEYKGFAEDVREHLRYADCFVLPTAYNEGLSRGIMEAASMELPVITTNQRGCKELVMEGETGLLCKLNDAVDLAKKMEQILLLSDTERNMMGKAGRKLVSGRFHIRNVIEEYDNLVATSHKDLQ